MAVDTTARGLLMLRPRPRLSPAMAMAATDVVMAVTAVATDTARGRLRPSPATAMAVTVAAMVVTAVAAMAVTAVATDTARGLLRPSPATAMAVTAVDTAATATGVSYHRIRRSELSQKQNHKNSQCSSCENMKKKEIYLHGLF